MNRREFLQTTAAVGAVICSGSLLLPQDALAVTNMADFWLKSRFLEARRADTGEKQLIRFYDQQYGYDPYGYRAACWLLRDAKDRNAMVSVDIGLLNLVYAIQEWARMSGRTNPLITVNSAYRTPRRNAVIEGAARHSLHIQGRAIDITMRGVDLRQIEAMAKYFKVGGVGIYRSFIHLDTGRVRSWRG
ncbi:YcbK family protein [Stenoxybacter acetivorans]|uniref:YcbK family protein n=1 Tax=Stenoxybacter acetivorans TaxID=422441 RepID=UPI00056BFCEA|nr:DUF882 domain-containing protein [Stenoxybacter acetivorans]